ncbi:MAG TPA: hypothetical protein DCZ01_01125 [Elusimicrobia bacterium]|nr:MAG: hypothetical protein A2X37_03225 [Elusimicrobia bacterium GWA2_66_18]OGR70349.1 MAG: hypothetical protein A2X40_04230 [Elusimicrobia bacterium GWC2_65_9]HAZ07135.1 hypothetical protein [Elusimicrobiota bacterium]
MKRLPTILFVCVENSCRSQMAEGFARRHGAGKVAAWSAGSRPSGKVNETEWDYVITMGCGDAPKHMSPDDFRKVRDLVARHLRCFLSESAHGEPLQR